MTNKETKHAWYVAHAEEVKARSVQWAIDNPERSKELNKKKSQKYEAKNKRWKDPIRTARAKKWAKDHPERIAQIVRKHNYGISAEEYDTKFKTQNGLCAICGKAETHEDHRYKKVRTLSVDHDHKTGKNRDLLCGNCNRGLGLFFDNEEALFKAIEYLKKHKQ